jgi:hypothetical protein
MRVRRSQCRHADSHSRGGSYCRPSLQDQIDWRFILPEHRMRPNCKRRRRGAAARTRGANSLAKIVDPQSLANGITRGPFLVATRRHGTLTQFRSCKSSLCSDPP